MDDLLSDLLRLPHGTDLHDHPLVAEGSLILQVRAQGGKGGGVVRRMRGGKVQGGGVEEARREGKGRGQGGYWDRCVHSISTAFGGAGGAGGATGERGD